MSAEGFEAVSEAVVGESLYVENYSSFATVRYVGPTEFSKGVWVGLELPTPTGKNDGSVKGQRYFPCEVQHGIFVRLGACTRPRQHVGDADGSAAGESTAAAVPHILPPAPPAEDGSAQVVSGPNDKPARAGLQVLGSLIDPSGEASESSDDEDEEGSYGRPLSPPLNIAASAEDDSEGELEVCLEGGEKPKPRAVPAAPVEAHAAMDAYLAAQASRKAPGVLSLVAAMESSVHAIVSTDAAYGGTGVAAGTASDVALPVSKDPFGEAAIVPAGPEESATPVAAEPDVFGIAYKPFKKTIGAGVANGPKHSFEDEDEFEKELDESAIVMEKAGVIVGAGQTDDEFDFDSDCPALDSSQLKRTLAAAAEQALAADAADAQVKDPPMVDRPPALDVAEERNSDSPSSYDAYGNAKDALRAIVDVYGCGLGDQEIVIMNSLGADAAATAATAHHHAPVALGASVVPGTGTVSRSKASTKRSSGGKNVKSKIEREKIIEEDEEDYEQRERELEEAKLEEERKARMEAAILESEWRGVVTGSPAKQQRKSLGISTTPRGKNSPRGASPQAAGRSPVPPSPVGIGGVEDGPAMEAYDTLLKFFKAQNLTQYHSEIITTSDSAKSSWLLGGSVKLNFEGSEDELKFCFSIAHVNYDPVKFREHFSALKTMYKFFVPSLGAVSPTPGGRSSRARDVGMVGAHWGNIGFQGLDPCTDINRSMRMLSVLQVLYLIQKYPDFARCLHMLSQHSVCDEKGKVLNDLTWPFFCVSIGFTRDALQTLRGKVLNKRCNKFKSVMAALHEFYIACFYTFARDLLEKPAVHHAHHLSSLRTAVENAPMNVLKNYKTFIKKKTKTGDMSPHEVLCSVFDGHPCGIGGIYGGRAHNSGSTPEVMLETEHLEFAALDDIKDSVDNRAPSPLEKGKGGLFSLGRKKGYEA